MIDLARRETERCDRFGGFLLMQSLAGGTGAGFGSRVAEELRDAFPSAFQLSHSVWPYESGEVIVQAYNALLTVQALLAACDGVILVQNEALHSICTVRPLVRVLRCRLAFRCCLAQSCRSFQLPRLWLDMPAACSSGGVLERVACAQAWQELLS